MRSPNTTETGFQDLKQDRGAVRPQECILRSPDYRAYKVP